MYLGIASPTHLRMLLPTGGHFPFRIKHLRRDSSIAVANSSLVPGDKKDWMNIRATARFEARLPW
jgi:hypothetical protein